MSPSFLRHSPDTIQCNIGNTPWWCIDTNFALSNDRMVLFLCSRRVGKSDNKYCRKLSSRKNCDYTLCTTVYCNWRRILCSHHLYPYSATGRQLGSSQQSWFLFWEHSALEHACYSTSDWQWEQYVSWHKSKVLSTPRSRHVRQMMQPQFTHSNAHVQPSPSHSIPNTRKQA